MINWWMSGLDHSYTRECSSIELVTSAHEMFPQLWTTGRFTICNADLEKIMLLLSACSFIVVRSMKSWENRKPSCWFFKRKLLVLFSQYTLMLLKCLPCKVLQKLSMHCFYHVCRDNNISTSTTTVNSTIHIFFCKHV